MLDIRDFTHEDIPALEKAIAADKFHGDWKVEHFQIPNTVTLAIEDSKGVIAFVLYSDSEIEGQTFLRISCVWADGEDVSRNARAIIHGIRHAVEVARVWEFFAGVVIETSYSKLANFLTKVMKMERKGNEYFLYV